MNFEKQGTSYALDLSTPAAIREAMTADESFWIVTSAPTSAFTEDPAFLAYLDADGNGRIRTDEVRAAVAWLYGRLADEARIGEESDELPLSSLSKDAEGAAGLFETISYVNEQAGRSGESIRLDDVRKAMAELRAKPLNGDGVLITDAAGADAALAAYIDAAVKATGGTQDLSGKQGVSSDQLAAFSAAVKDFLAWKALGRDDNADTMPFGADTPALYAAFAAHKDLIDRFFFLADFLRYDAAAAERFLAASATSDTPAGALDAAPLARPTTDGSLPLEGDWVNPLHRARLATLRTTLFEKVLPGGSRTSVTAAEWEGLKASMARHEAYLAAKKGAIVESFPEESLRAWTEGPFAARAEELQKLDRVVADRCAAFSDVEKLLLFRRRMPRFLRNFISLADFYNPKAESLFECGRLLIDGRWFNLAIKIADPAAHASVAKNGGLFVMYLKIEPVGGGAPFTVVVPATAGTRGCVQVGKRGVFFDRNGREYDATVVSMIENPISLREAMLAPFRNMAKMLLGKIEALSNKAQSSLEKGAEGLTDKTLAGQKPAAPAPAAGGNNGAGLLVGVSVAFAALGSTFAFIAKSLSSMSMVSRIVTIGVAILVVVGPILLAGLIKLFLQDVGPVLEGCGWAVNRRMRLTRKLRRQFTVVTPYPKNATGTPRDRASAFILLLLLLFLSYLLARLWWGW